MRSGKLRLLAPATSQTMQHPWSRPPGAADRHSGGSSARIQRRSSGPGSCAVCPRRGNRYSRRGDEILGQLVREYDTFIIAQAKAPASRLEGSILQCGLHPQPSGRGHPVPLHGVTAISGRALDVRMTSMTGGCRNTGGRCRRSGQWSTPTSGV